ncbi:MupA/Atu3671 family FMN-dependent luciferase-like monooxygenase [Sorangium sp. So ce834]|uniref:MupA/Atu3671 family FMN-dependent luciferase-like monooxygenase n=1 Tax=Sorangium sp. So ce834 TaxID=3133321 RepID=UPI003F628224
MRADDVTGREIREKIRAAFGELLAIEASSIDAYDDFAKFGMSSLDALKIAERLQSDLGARVAPKMFFDHPNIAELARVISREANVPSAPRPPDDPGGAVEGRDAKIEAILRLIEARKRPGPPDAPPPGDQVSLAARMRFSLLFFSDRGSAHRDAKYDLITSAAKFADRHGFEAIWMPERHFHPFGGIYPNPSVLAAHLAGITENVRLRAGSVVLPLEHPARVVEAWSMVDNLSRGRVDLAVASGWNPNDFVLSPQTFKDRRDIWLERISVVQKLWRGEPVSFPNGSGVPTEIVTYPRPIQSDLNIWLTATSKPESFLAAGRAGLHVLTMLQGSTPEELAEKVRAYRKARQEAGYDPSSGIVTLMLHTFIHEDAEYVRRKVQAPFVDYILSAIDAHTRTLARPEEVTQSQREQLAQYSYERYSRVASLLGTPAECLDRLEKFESIGVNEVACLVDFGVEPDAVLDGLPHIAELRRSYMDRRGRTGERAPPTLDSSRRPAGLAPEPRGGAATQQREAGGCRGAEPSAGEPRSSPAAATSPTEASRRASTTARSRGALPGASPEQVASPTAGEPIAIIGVAGRFPGSPMLQDFWHNLRQGRELTSYAPGDRLIGRRGWPNQRVGYLSDVMCFDPLAFGISPREAEYMDPHHRVFLETAWAAVEDAGYDPSALSGSSTGVFVAVYNHDYMEALLDSGGDLEAHGVVGVVHSMLPNRISYLLNLSGPSEVVDTACSSSLVAIHRAVRALRSGECDMAIAGGVSLLLTPSRLAGLAKLGILAEDGRCRAFDRSATGQVMGEGAGAVLLKPLAKARRDGDAVYGVLRGSAVNHHGRLSGSLMTPSAEAQADVIARALRDAGIPRDSITYIEAHGAGGVGDLAELSAFSRVFCGTPEGGARRAPCAVGSLKPNIGFLEAAGGIASLIKVLLCFAHRTIPPLINFDECPPGVDLASGPLFMPRSAQPWGGASGGQGLDPPRRACVHAYGLGGVNAHLVLEEPPPVEVEVGHAAKDGEERSELIVLSARTDERLLAYVQRLLSHLEAATGPEAPAPCPSLGDIAYTLQVGRPAFEVRLALIADSVSELKSTLKAVLDGGESGRVLRGYVRGPQTRFTGLGDHPKFRELVRSLKADGELDELARLWVEGFAIAWSELHQGRHRRRTRLPTYPFARHRYGIPVVRSLGDTPPGQSDGRDISTERETQLSNGSTHTPGCLEEPVSQVEAEVMAILTDVLKISPHDLEPDRQLSEYGIDSMLGLEVMKRIQDAFGPQMPTTAIVEHATGASLIKYIAREAAPRPRVRRPHEAVPATPAVLGDGVAPPALASVQAAVSAMAPGAKSLLTAVRSTGARRRSFWIHGSPGIVAWVNSLAHALGEDYPVYALQASGLREGEAPLATVPELASRYIDEIRRVQRSGPYILGGYSFGGMVAFEMAHQMLERGEAVSHLILLDSYAPGSKILDAALATMDAPRRLLLCGSILCALCGCQALPSFESLMAEGSGDAVAGAVAHMLRSGQSQLAPGELRVLLERMANVLDVHLKAERQYRARCYLDPDIKVALFRAREPLSASESPFASPGAHLPDADHAEVWSRLFTGGLTLFNSNCDHLSLMQRPYIDDVVAHLSRWIDG